MSRPLGILFVCGNVPINPEPLAPWRSPLSGALHRHRSLPHSRYLQLATVRPTGEPACRTVVFRGFLEGTNQIQVITDRRSQKICQIAHQSRGEACWYFPKTREQFRLAGLLRLVTAEETDSEWQAARTVLWQSISDAARSQFAAPPPDQPCTEAPETIVLDPPDALIPLDTFCLLLLAVDRVDHLQLRGNPQTRHWYEHNDQHGWTMLAVNP